MNDDCIETILSFALLGQDFVLQINLQQVFYYASQQYISYWFSCCYRAIGGVKIGEHCFFNNYCTLASRAGITIGAGTLFGENVKVYDHNHCYKDTSIPIKDQGYTSAPITIGKHCWIGSNVVILKGVTIGDNCVIGAGCVIYKDVPDNSVVVNHQNQVIQRYGD